VEAEAREWSLKGDGDLCPVRDEEGRKEEEEDEEEEKVEEVILKKRGKKGKNRIRKTKESDYEQRRVPKRERQRDPRERERMQEKC